MAGCLDKQTLAALARGELTQQATAAAEAHLEKCRRCARALAELDVDDELIERIRELERSRGETDAALSGLKQVEERVTTTLFGGAAK